ncbi:hypothetical protein B0H10DRAFT_2213199 [Mycena sp. CBHHK59/15]|nr:hypothetical protein B0H10DRAFT_2213199 [Mycena sp. CBHHK59/15]
MSQPLRPVKAQPREAKRLVTSLPLSVLIGIVWLPVTQHVQLAGESDGSRLKIFCFDLRMSASGGQPSSGTSSAEDLDTSWQKDAHLIGQATCPKCGAMLKYGTAGIINLVKRHLDSPKCLAAVAKKDKQPRQNGSLKNFFKKATPLARIFSTVRAPSPIRGEVPAAEFHSELASTSAQPSVHGPISLAAPSRAARLLDQLRTSVQLLPSTVPTADINNPLAVFSGIPSQYVSEHAPAIALWEELAPLFHKAFGYGEGHDSRVRLIERGNFGLDGALRFLDYFVRERFLEGGQVELKIEQLIEAVQSVNSSSRSPGNSARASGSRSPPRPTIEDVPDEDDFRPQVGLPLDGPILELAAPGVLPSAHSSSSTARSETDTAPKNPGSAIIDVDVDVDMDTETPEVTIVTPPASRKSLPCSGFLFPFSGAGKTASSDYPYALHDTLPLPWTYSSNADGTLTLRSTACKKVCSKERSNCRACADLPKDETLQGILGRAKDGVHEKSNYVYHSFAGLIELLHRKNKRIEELRMRGFNAAKRIARQARSLTDHKRFVRAIGSGKVENIDRLVRVQLDRKQGIRGLLTTYDKAVEGVYHTKSYTEQDDLRGVLLWKLAGNRVADFAHRALGLPSRTTLAKRTTVPPIVPSPGKPKASEVAENVGACFEGITDVLAAKKPKHAVLMYDEIATEKLGLQFNNERDLEELFRAKEEDKIHFAGEATVAALGILSDERRLYSARPVLISADCKRETGLEHLHNVLNPTIDGVNSKRELTGLRIISLASDGETRRGKAFVEKTFTHSLKPESDIYDELKDLLFMDFQVGEDDLTADKDPKHVFKRGRNRLLRMLGMKVFGVQITPAIIRAHLQHAGHSSQHINADLCPDDKQDVKQAYELLKDIWSLPPAPEGSSPGFTSARHALRIIGSLFYHLLFPYICVDLTLSEQLEHLSAAAHLNLLLYRDGQKDALPTLLFTDIMIMIKNVYFSVAKAKKDDPEGRFWLILLGTDRLEELFGILRTMIGNDRNLDVLQLVERITGTMEIANIFARYPHWDRPPRRLQLPVLAKDGSILDCVDHLKPHSWRGDNLVANVTLLTCWNRGRRLIEEEWPSLGKYFRALDNAYDITILSPLGEFILKKDLDPDDNEDDDEEVESTPKSSVSPDLEDAAVDEDVLTERQAPEFTKFITVQDKPLRKTRALSLMQKYGYKAGSTDRLKRVADVQRYSAKLQESSTIIESESPYLLVSEPVATLDRKVEVHFQILSLIPAATEDDPDSKHDWRSSGVLRDVLTTHGRLVLPVDPTLSTRVVGKPYYLFESSVLRAFGAQLLDEVTLDLNKKIPKFTPTSSFPYREASGFACFVCEGDNQIDGLEETDSHSCLKCKPPHALNINKPQTVLMHMGTHILYDSTIHASDQPCGFFAKHKDLWELSESEKVAMQNIWKKLKEPSKKATRKKKPQTTLKISAAHSSRRALVVEGPEQSDHSDAPDASDDDSFMNLDSPIPSPKAPQDYDSELELPTVEWRSPSPLEYIPDSDLPSTQIRPLLQSVPETEDLADHDEQENGSSAPATMPDAVSSAPTSSAPPGITVTPNLGAEPTARRSGRKRKEREELKDLSAALSACICGSSAAPLDSSEHPNVVSGEWKGP